MGLFDGLFKQKPTGFLGVDVGSSGLKVVELQADHGRPKLMTYGYSQVSAEQAAASLFDDPQAAGKLLASVCQKAGVKATAAMAALPASSVFSAIIAVPRAPNATAQQLKPLIDAQVAKLAPLPLADMVTYSTFIDDLKKPPPSLKPAVPAAPVPGQMPTAPAPKKQEYVRVLVTGAAKTLVQKYVEMFRVAKLELKAIDSEGFALIRALIGRDRSTIALLDIGAKRTNITIVEKGVPFVTRSINLGGDGVTKRIMEQMKVSETDAEQLKVDMALAEAPNGAPLPPAIEAMLQPIVHEIKFAFQLFGNMELTESKRVEKLVITGGSSLLPRLPEYLSQALNLNVYRGDPWARVAYPAELRPVLEEVGPRLAVAIGLAMRDIE